jgi:hypothetical protein
LRDQGKLLQLAVGAGLIIIIVVGGFALYRIAAVDRKTDALQTSMNDVQARLERLNTLIGGTSTGVVGLLRAQAQNEKALARIEAAAAAKSQGAAKAPMTLPASEAAALRAYFKLAPKAEPPRFKLGDKVPAADLKPIPEPVAGTIAPSLKGTSFAIDQNGALVVTSGADKVVVLVLAPN